MVPEANEAEARRYAEDLPVVSVGTLDEALAELEQAA